MRAILIFVDGMGLGDNDPAHNPFIFTPTKILSGELGGMPLCSSSVVCHGEKATLISLDATLGVSGLPQSATGQTALFTGLNAPSIVGGHLNRHPTTELKELLRNQGILKELKESGFKPAFINAYRPPFFDELNKALHRSHSCSTMMNFYAGLPFRTLEDIKNREALYMDITNEYLARTGFPLKGTRPEDAAEILLNISKKYDFTFFEYFLSDVAGHLGEREHASKIVKTLDAFLGNIIKNLNHEETLLIITSDHGNIEDLSQKNHTFNPVPAIIAATENIRLKAAEEIKDITHVAPFIKSFLNSPAA